MSLTPQTITIDLNPSFSQMQTVHCSQYDDNIRQIEVKLKDGGTDIDVSSYTIYIEGTKPDKKGFSYALTDIGSVSGNTVTFYIQLQMAAVPGMTRMEILLKDGDDHRIGSANFMLAVERAGLQDDTNVSDSELAPYISGAAEQAAAAARSAEAAELAKDDAIQAKDDAIQAKESAEQSAESISGLSEQIEQNTEDITDLQGRATTLEGEMDTAQDDLTNLKRSLQFETQPVVVKEGLYVDDGAFIGTRANCQIVLVDLTQIPNKSPINVNITGTQNRCRLLLMTANIADVADGTTGRYIDKGGTTTSFTLEYVTYKGYKTLAICTNFQLTPFATLTVESVVDLSEYGDISAETKENSFQIFGIDESVSRTVQTGSNQNYYYFDSVIPAESYLEITNNSATSSFSVNLFDSSNVIHSYGSVSAGATISFTLKHDVSYMRSYVETTDWSFRIKVVPASKKLFETMSTASYCKNLVGQDTSIYYPVYIPANTKFTMSTADGQPVGVNNVALIGYNENKEDVTNYGWDFRQDLSSRMVSWNVDIYYLRWSKVIEGRPFQVELGDTATEYQEYFPNPNVIERYPLADDSALKATDIFNAEPYTGTYDWQTPVVNYGKLFKGKSHVESFAFFTDPHVLGGADDNRNETRMENYLKRVQKVFNSTPCSYLVCGGDWLNNSTTMDEACYRLGYLKGIANHLLDGCKLVLGNHDTNYQGKLDASSENNTGRLTDSTIASIMFRDTDTKKAYYSFDGDNAKCYVLDTGIEHSTMLAYDWEQIDWLANELKKNDTEHAIIFLHIINDTNQTEPYVFASNCGNLVQAYNSHSNITLNGVSYSFTQCTGHVDFWAAGHNHTDSTGTLGGIPYFITATKSFSSDVPLIDLVLVDYDAGTINLVRVGGTGSDRVINM